MNPASKQQIVLVHGRGAKPNAQALQELWTDALVAGLRRDVPDKLQSFHASGINMVYYADLLTEFAEPGFDETLDLDNRRQALDELATRTKARDFRRKNYEVLPGKTPLKEFAMDFSASIGLGTAATKKTMPELFHYWQDDDGWAARLRMDFAERVQAMMSTNTNILIISHGMGCVVAWDALWQISQASHKTPNTSLKRITRWITLGSPLGAHAVQSKLSGRDQPADERYPTVLNAWHNISAEDDYVCHDKTVADDYKDMLNQRIIGDIRDHTIYNLAVRYGRSNPHSSVGYLIHPRTTALLADWLD